MQPLGLKELETFMINFTMLWVLKIYYLNADFSWTFREKQYDYSTVKEI